MLSSIFLFGATANMIICYFANLLFSEYDTGILIYKNNAKTFSLKLENWNADKEKTL